MRLASLLVLPIALVLPGVIEAADKSAAPATRQATGQPAAPMTHDTEEFADLGKVEILHSGTANDDLLLLLDDASGGARDLARQLAEQGHWVAYLPARHLLDNAAKHHDECIDATTLLDVFSQQLQQKYRFPRYRQPVVIGSGRAAALAYSVLAQSPQRQFAAGIGIDFCPTVALPAPPCRGNSALRWDDLGHGQYRLQPVAHLPAPWTAFGTGRACNAPNVDAFGASTPVTLVDLPARIAAIAAPKPAPASASATTGPASQTPAAVDDLGLVELPAKPGAQHAGAGRDDLFVILLSGDGGWADIDKDIGEKLNGAGLPVVGWNTLQYFWTRKTPEIAGKDLQRVIAHYGQLWQKQRVLLIGFSLGADVLPFMISRLPAEERGRIADVALLSLSHSVDFEFHVSAWLGSSQGDTHQVAPELKKLGEPVLCIYGSDDDDTLCREFRAPNVANVGVPGDHHYGGDIEAVTKKILQHMEQQHAAR